MFWGNIRGQGGAAYLRVRDDTVFLEDGKKMASVNLAIVVAKFVVGHVRFFVEKGCHSDYWRETGVLI